MEFGLRELITFATLIVTVASSFVLIKAKTAELQKELERIARELTGIHSRIDSCESEIGILKHQNKILSTINSPSNLEKHHREIADIKARMLINTRDIQSLHKMHNGSHPKIGKDNA